MAIEPVLWAIVVTYRRPDSLAQILDDLSYQTRPPDHTVVIDNASDGVVANSCSSYGVQYVAAVENLGPAGGIALGMEMILSWAHPRDWIVLVDDDDPPGRNDLIEVLLGFGEAQLRADPRTGGVGRVGSPYDRLWGRMQRLPDKALAGPVLVDSIGGNQYPHYRVAAVTETGVFDRRLFFGFDDLEFGLRMRRAGFNLYAHGELWFRGRARAGRLNLPPAQLRTSTEAAAWRRYYTARNATWIARRYGLPVSALVTATRGGVGGFARLLQARRPLKEALLPIQGVRDGFVGQLGRTVDPGTAKKTHVSP